MDKNTYWPLLLAVSCVVPSAHAAPDGDIADLSLEQLSEMVITSVSRQEERLNNAAASIYIINSTDIRRSGVRSLAEALRLAPNLQVARVDARNYAITARGFSSPFVNKLLVLIDGRSVYSPFFSAVFWDVQDVVMEDIERIEVISGPGASIWGVNAVNGVINVITRSAKDSKGGLASATGGPHEKDATLRYGGTLGQGGVHFRACARYVNYDNSETAAGLNTRTGMQRSQAGFRSDWDNGFTVSGDAYSGTLNQLGTTDILVSGANVTSRFQRRLANDADVRVQLVLDHTERNQPGNYVDRLDTWELEGQHSLRAGSSHNLAWGAGYRQSRDHNTPRGFGFTPNQLTMHWGNVFAQDEYALNSQLRLTGGAKVEHNNYTGTELLPTARLAWTPDSKQLAWASVARTVRAPARVDRDLVAPALPRPLTPGGVPRYNIGPSNTFESEVARVVELGYRIQPALHWSVSATLWQARYDKLRTLELNTGPALPNTGLLEFRNLAEARTRGLELWGRWQPMQHWRLNGGLVVQDVDTWLKPGSRDSTIAAALGTNDPKRYWQLRSSHDLSDTLMLDWILRYTGSLPQPVVPSYHEMDVQLLWKPRPTIEVALLGQNLLHASHPEFGALPGRSVFQRTALLKMTVRF